jgi:hypothetical protein
MDNMAPSATNSSLPLFPDKSLKSSSSPLPKVQSFDAATVSTDDLVKALKIARGAIIQNFLNTDDDTQIEHDIRPHLDADSPWKGDFFPPASGDKNETSTSLAQLNNTVIFSIGPGARN